MMKLLICLFTFSAAACGSDDSQPIDATLATEATYLVTLETTWSAASHPKDYPASAHFSPLVGASHASSTSLYEQGAAASPGMKSMAETGATGTLIGEIDGMIAADQALASLLGSGIGTGAGTTSQMVMTNESHPEVTAVSMIAPSPDWFLAARVNLRENGAWKDKVVVDAIHLDAGTDSGAAFASANSVTNPPETITTLDLMSVAGSTAIMGTFTFERQ